jgi:hypothetical protein
MLKLRMLKWICAAGSLLLLLLPHAPVISAQQSQQTQNPSAPPKPAPKDPEQSSGTGAAPGQAAPPENDRIFGVVPNYNTVYGVNRIPPLTVKEKFTLAAKGIFDPYEFPIVGLIALRAQAQNDDPAWGQGMKGYGIRYGAAFGDQFFGGFMTSAIFPSMLKQDPRYYRRGEGRFLTRTGYSLSRIMVGRSDSGHRMFNFSEFGGNAVAAGISDSYHTSDQRTISGTASSWATQMGVDALGNLAKEFWPDIKHALHKKHKTE